MNKNCYRIIFSKAKNMFVAVAENIKSKTKSAGQNTQSTAIIESVNTQDSKSFHQLWQVKSIVASMSLFMIFSPVYAQMQADPAAGAHQQASIGVGQNQQGQNVPVVNIQTPKNGVSHNVYNQFDVLQPGVVLNNSRNGAGSVIVGQVGANPYLQTGEARVILNEVNSASASRFEGNLEVAGQRADVIIANPSGINIQGGGFINANKAIFTTGKPQLNEDGSIKQFVVDQGKINVTSNGNNLGLGGNNNNADYVDIYAKAVELNAQVHANQALQVVTGSNTISNDLSTITPNQENSTSPTFALDVKALGGMYANNIYIIGTDKGLGVSNAGTIQSPQSLVITSAGKIENTGTIQNTNPQGSLLSISTADGADIVSSGSMLTNGNLFLESGQNITLDRARLEKIGADNKNIISVSAKGDVNLQNSTNVQNFGEGGDLYIDASNINLGNDINIGINGSIVLEAQQNLKAEAVRNISSINDINMYAGDLLSLNNTPLLTYSGNINFSTNKAGSSIALNSTRLNAEKDVNIYGAGTVSINNLGLDKVGETSKTKNFNVNAQGDLTWQKAGASLPIFTGKLDLRSNGKLDISGSKYITNDGINLVGKELIVDSQLKSNKDINLTASENDLNLNLGTELSAGSDINVSALKGNLNSIDLKAKSDTGQVSLIAYGNTNLNKNKPFIIFPDIPGFPSTPGVASDAIVIEAKNGVVIGSTGTGNTTIEAAKINSTESGIKIRSEGGANINDTSLNAKGNIEIFAKNDLVMKGLSSNSQSHTALHSDKSIVLDTSTNNAWVTKDLSYIPSGSLDSTSTQYSQLNSLGVLSLTSNLDQNISNSNLVGGAVLIESGGALNVVQSAALKPRQTFVINATGSDFLKNDANLQKINGNLSINTKSDLVLNAIDNSGRSFESKEVKPIFTSTGLMDIKTEGNLTLNGKTPPVNNNKLQQLMVDPAALKSAGGINLNASSIHLNSASLINSSAEKAVNLISTTGNIAVNVLNQNEVNQSQYDLLNPIQNRRDELIASGKTDNTTQNLIESLNKEVEFYLADLNGSRNIGSTINSDSDINITSKSGVLLRSADIHSKGNINIEAQGLLDRALTATNPEDQVDAAIVIDGTVDLFKRGLETDPNYMERSLVNSTAISADKDINITSSGNSGEILWTDNPQLSGDYTQAELQPIQLKKVINNAKDNIVINAADLISKGNINIKSNGNIVMESGVEEAYDKSTTMHVKESWAGLKRKSKITREQKQLATAIPTILTGNNINLQARGDIELYSTLMEANGGKVDIAGENLYFFTSKELDKYNSDSKSTSSLLGIKYDTTKINSNRTSVSQLPVRLQGDYLSTDSNQDTIFVGTQFDYLKDATIKANGDIALLGASNIIEESKTLEKNSVVWQKMEGEGSTIQTMTLPSFNGPTAPVFNAEGGLIVQIPISEQDQNKVQIKDEIVKLSNQPGYEYLKELTQRNDVDWNRVILAQKDWDYKSQGLTGAGAAIIVIIVTVLTAGAGTGAATSVAGATGSTALGAGAQAAVATLASQASVSLINNGGDIGKTLKDLGSKESVKGLVASVVTAGLLNQVGTALNLNPDSALLSDRIINNFTNSVGSTLVQTAVNGGSLQDNLEAAFLSGLVGVVQGQLAFEIKPLENIDYVLHKIAHAAVGCLAASIQKQCEAGAIGASIGEIVASYFNDGTRQLTESEKEQIIAKSKIVAATIAAYTGHDVNMAAATADTAVRNNNMEYILEIEREAKYLEGLSPTEQAEWNAEFQKANLTTLEIALFISTMYPGARLGKWGVDASKGFFAWNAARQSTINVLKSPKTVWNKSLNEIVADFEKAGFSTSVRQSTRGSKKAEIIEVKGHPSIQQIQVHPGGGRHGGSYYKISTSDQGIIKIVDKQTYVPTPGEKATIIFK